MDAMHNDEMRRCMMKLDVAGARRLWKHVNPNLPQPKSDEEALTSLHMARTASRNMPATARLYSHDWLIERGLPSQLPNEMLPKARRVDSRIVQGVGIAVVASSLEMKPVATAVQKAMSDAVADAYADGRGQDVDFVRARMAEARAKTRKQLLGGIRLPT